MSLKSTSLILLLAFSLSIIAQSEDLEIIQINGVDAVKGEILIKFKKPIGKLTRNSITAARENLLEKHQGTIKKKFTVGVEHWQVTTSSLEELLSDLNKHEFVEYAEPNYILRADAVIPNDPYFNDQWGLHNTGQTGGLEDADIDAPEAWEITTGDTSIVVGVIDSGIDYLHEDLRDNIWVNKGEIPNNGIDDDDNGYIDDYYGWDFINGDNDPMDDNGHGTHVAGIIGAKGNNGIGISGVAWNCKMMALKFLGADGSGPTSAAIEAIYYSIQMGVKITNNSWGGSGFSEALKEAIFAADSAGAIFIVAAGNDAVDNDLMPHFPSSYDNENIVSVAATDRNKNLSGFSNWGFSSVDLAAPGSEIYSTIPNGYGYKSGTSMAAPFVTGVALLIWSENPSLSSLDIINQLFGSMSRNNDLFGKVKYGGVINLLTGLSSNNRVEFTASKIEIYFGAELINSGSAIQSFYIINNKDKDIIIDTIKVGNQYGLAVGNNEFRNTLSNKIINSKDSLEVKVKFLPQLQGFIEDELSIIQIRDGLPAKRNVILYGYSLNKGTVINEEIVSGTWNKENSPYYINTDILIDGNNSLTISPGTKVVFTDNYKFEVINNVKLIAEGTRKDSIIFTALYQDKGWAGIRIIESGDDEVFRYCRFEYGRKYGKGFTDTDENQGGGAVAVKLSNPKIINCLFYKNFAYFDGGGLRVNHPGSVFILDSCSFIDNQTGNFGGGGALISSNHPVIVKNSYFKNNYSAQGTLNIQSTGTSVNELKEAIIFNNNFRENVTANGGSAIYVAGYKDVSIFKNLLTKNIDYSRGGVILLDGLQKSLIYNNTVFDNEGSSSNSLLLVHTDKSKIVNNILWNEDVNEILLFNTDEEPIINNNIIYENHYGSTNISEEPNFIDQENFLLSENSPGKKAGFNNGFYKNSENSLPDIGYTGSNHLAVFDHEVDFQKVGISDTKVISFPIYNLADHSVSIDSFSSSENIIIKNYEVEKILEKDERLSIDIEFFPYQAGAFNDSLKIYFSDAAIETAAVHLMANVIEGNTLQGEINGQLSKENSPYFVTDDILVSNGNTLEILEGTEIYFHADKKLKVDGKLIIKGTDEENVILTSVNDSIYWGGIDFKYRAESNINNCIIDNFVRFSVHTNNDKVKIENSSFSDAKSYETIIYTELSDVVFKNTKFIGNDANGAAIISLVAANVQFVNSLFQNNSGSLFANSIIGYLRLINCTAFDNNLPSDQEGNYYLLNAGTSGMGPTKTEIVNSILYNSKPLKFSTYYQRDAIEPPILNIHSSFITQGEAAFENTGFDYTISGNLYNGDPGFFDSSGTLNSSSQCIDVGANSYWENKPQAIDLAGNTRIWNNIVDLGAYEYGSQPVSVEDNSLPLNFSLSQNFPNPFNPACKIKYEVASPRKVELRVYDILGRVVDTLVSEIQSAGEYEIKFDASHLASGVYFYKITAGSFVETKKMLLMK